MAVAVGWLAGRGPAVAPAVGHCTGRGRTGTHTTNPLQLSSPHSAALTSNQHKQAFEVQPKSQG